MGGSQFLEMRNIRPGPLSDLEFKKTPPLEPNKKDGKKEKLLDIKGFFLKRALPFLATHIAYKLILKKSFNLI